MRTTIRLAFLALLTALLLACGNSPPATTATPTPNPSHAPAAQAAAYTITGPFDHQNLSLFLIHSPDRLQGKTYLTLQEALDQKKVVVNETGSVNELTIENVSNDDVYIQSGEIVKGGRQDRTLQNDLVLAPKSGKIPVAAFCVEHGRWQQRGGENAAQFDSSQQSLSSKYSKLAAKSATDQGMVWSSVEQSQARLSENVGKSVHSQQSASSLQLSLEDKDVQKALDAYRAALQKITAGQPDVVGYAFAINGKLNSVDIYASNNLFQKMWNKNLDAAAAEAFADFKKDQKYQPLTPAVVKACLEDAKNAPSSEKTEHHKVTLITRESANNRAYETYAPNAASPAHLNIITRDPETDKMLQKAAPSQRLQGLQQNDIQQQQVPPSNASPTNLPPNNPQTTW